MNNKDLLSSHIANLLIPFCEAASINCRIPDAALIKRIIVSFSFLNIEQLYEQLYPREHIDWQSVKEYLQEVHYSTSDWIQLVSLIDFIHEITPNQPTLELISSTLAGMRTSIQGKKLNPLDSLRLCFAKGGVSPTWDMLCKAFLLFNIVDIDSDSVLLYLLSNTPRPSETCIQEILKHMPSIFRHSPEDHSQICTNILRINTSCHVRSHIIMQSLKMREEITEKKRISNRSLFYMNEKPSLTKILEMKQGTETNTDKTIENFASFVEEARLPSNANAQIKRIIYYLKCLPPQHATHLYDTNCIPRIVSNDEVIMYSIQKINIITPDLTALKHFLSETYFTGIPFPGLKNFRQTCLPQQYSVTKQKSIHWSTIFRLYLCIHCREDLIKPLWLYVWSLNENAKIDHTKLNYTLNNTESENSIQSYVNNNTFNLDDILKVLLDTT